MPYQDNEVDDDQEDEEDEDDEGNYEYIDNDYPGLVDPKRREEVEKPLGQLSTHQELLILFKKLHNRES